MDHFDLIFFLGTFMFSFVGAFYFDARKAEAQYCRACADAASGRAHSAGLEI